MTPPPPPAPALRSCVSCGRYFVQTVLRQEQQNQGRRRARARGELQGQQGVLELVEGRPRGILCMLDEMCRMPQPSDKQFTENLHSEHADNALIEARKQQPTRQQQACITRAPLPGRARGICFVLVGFVLNTATCSRCRRHRASRAAARSARTRASL